MGGGKEEEWERIGGGEYFFFLSKNRLTIAHLRAGPPRWIKGVYAWFFYFFIFRKKHELCFIWDDETCSLQNIWITISIGRVIDDNYDIIIICYHDPKLNIIFIYVHMYVSVLSSLPPPIYDYINKYLTFGSGSNLLWRNKKKEIKNIYIFIIFVT